MARRTVFIVAWSAGLVLFAALLERWSPPFNVVRAAMGSEPVHVVAHSALYGVLALALRPGSWSRPRWALAAAVFFAVAMTQEGAQLQARHRLPNQEEYFDLTVDMTGATLALSLRAAAAAL